MIISSLEDICPAPTIEDCALCFEYRLKAVYVELTIHFHSDLGRHDWAGLDQSQPSNSSRLVNLTRPGVCCRVLEIINGHDTSDAAAPLFL